jgi:acyl-CoA synthetase (AMP-forming)/AMP-acid ligase II
VSAASLLDADNGNANDAGDAGGRGGLDLDAVTDDDLALLIYTSGTTGRAKGCAHTFGGLRAGLGALMDLWGIGAGDVVVNALPLFHVHGLCVALLGPLWAGATVRLLPRFSPEGVVDAVRAGGTVFMSVPTMVHRMIGHLDERPDDAAVLARLRLFTCGSAALSAEQLERLRARTGLTILERYGMSETLITVSNRRDARRPGAVGWAVPSVQTRVVDDELQVRGPGVMRGYWNRPDADREVFVTDEHGGPPWFRTGDVVAVDDEGCIRIVGRASQDILKVGGYKLSAREIEEEIARHPDIAEVAVVGIPDEEWGERVCAIVVPRAGRAPELAALQGAVRLHESKKPRVLLVRDALPRNALGKVLKPELKAWASAASTATAAATTKASP